MVDNTKWQKLRRARNRVFESVLEGDSAWMIEQAYSELLEIVGQTDKSHVSLDDLIRDANNYIIAIQGGHSVVVSKKSPYAKKLIADADKCEEENENRKLIQRMQDFRKNRGV